MYAKPYEFVSTPDGSVLRIRARGAAVLSNPAVNRGTAFTATDREALGLTGLLPSRVSTIDEQARRVYAQFSAHTSDLAKWVYLAALHDRNEVLFHRLVADHLAEMLPIVYTPTVGLAIERFSTEFRRAHGVYLSINSTDAIWAALRNTQLTAGDVDIIVATDAEGILGIGDQGVGGIEIAVGKLAVYTAAAGLDPHRVLPVMLDVGTDNAALLDDDMYLGARHPRVRESRYDGFLDSFVDAASTLFPDAMLHWEDFGAGNARRVLNRYRHKICTFNDDMQGTAAVVLAAALSATRVTGTLMRDQRVVIYGAGTAGLGIADMMRDAMIAEGVPRDDATRRFWALGSRGLLVDDEPRLRDFQVPYARPAAEVLDWSRASNGAIDLAEVVAQIAPTILIGTSAQPRAFTETIVRQMAAHTARPIIMPLSNPTSKCEALPEDVLNWTDGGALLATGSPFPPAVRDGIAHRIAQANNALIFPGLGLGVSVARASRISDAMIRASADCLAQLCDTSTPGAPLLPAIDDLRIVSAAVAVAVATAAAGEGLARRPLDNPVQQVQEAMWQADYAPIIAEVDD